MTALRAQLIRDLFDQALQLPADQRCQFLGRECHADAALMFEIEQLLDSFVESHEVFGPTGDRDPLLLPNLAEHALIGRQIGRYTIRRLIGTGGMGLVFEAIQEHPRRSVALKLMGHGLASEANLRRFETESETLGRLRHPNIAQVYDAGTHDDGSDRVPYFAMEYIPGARSLTDYAREQELSIRQRLALYVKVCHAVHYGHQKGIIHRDLKPSNLLVDSGGEPKVIDFGIARAIDSDTTRTAFQTAAGTPIGTIQYMSPEQSQGDAQDLDTRSDVYSLGVVLYEILCERLPYEVPHSMDAARIIRDAIPPRPGTTSRLLRGDVETIVLKALEKDRDVRYQSAADLGSDIQRHLNHEPIMARPPSLLYQVQTFARRNMAVATAVSALMLVLVISIVFISVSLATATQAKQSAQDAIMVLGTQLGKSIELADGAGAKKEDLLSLINSANEELETRFADHSELELRMRGAISGAYQRIGEFQKSKSQMERAIQISKQTFGEDHPSTIQIMSRLASIDRDMVDHEHAGMMYEAVIAASRRTRSEFAWVGNWADYADMLHDLGRCSEAAQLLREALAIREIHDSEEARSPYYLIQLARVFCDQNRQQEAEQLLVEALATCRHTMLDEQAVCTCELGRLYLDQRRFDQARSLQQQALEMYRAHPMYGDDHLQTLVCMELGGLIDREQGRLTEAERTFADAAQRAEKSLRAEPKWWGASYRVQQGITLIAMGRPDEADRILHDAYDTLQPRLGDKHHRTQTCILAMKNLCEIQHDEIGAAKWNALLRPARCQ